MGVESLIAAVDHHSNEIRRGQERRVESDFIVELVSPAVGLGVAVEGWGVDVDVGGGGGNAACVHGCQQCVELRWRCDEDGVEQRTSRC